MLSKKLILAVVVCAAAAASQAIASNVFVLPGPNGNHTKVAVFTSDPFDDVATFDAAEASYNAISNATASRYFLVGRSGDDTLLVVDSGLDITQRFDLGVSAKAAALTPDGRRLLVVADNLRIFDATAGDLTEIVPSVRPNVGVTPIDVVVSHDSKVAWVLSDASNRLTKIDLSTYNVLDSLTFSGLFTGLAMAPGGSLWVTAQNRVYEVDGTTMTVRGQIAINAQPGRLAITPDGTHALAANQSLVTGTSVLLFDLVNRTLADTFPNFNDVVENVTVVSNSRAYAMSSATGRVFVITIDPFNVDEATFSNVSGGKFVDAAAITASDEVPSAKYLFVATGSKLTRVTLSSNTASTARSLPGAPHSAAFAGPHGTGSPDTVLKSNDNQTVVAGGTTLPLVVRVLNSAGRPLYNVPVKYSTSTAGATITGGDTRTGLDGFAQAVVKAPDRTGKMTVNAAIGSPTALSATFTVNVGSSGGGGESAGITIVAGNGIVLQEFQPSNLFGSELTVRITDSTNKPVSKARVNFEVTEGDGSVTLGSLGTLGTGAAGGQEVNVLTNADGLASVLFIAGGVNFGFSYEQSTVTATRSGSAVEFTVTTVISSVNGIPAAMPSVQMIRPSVVNRRITGKAGETIPDAIQARVTIAAGPQAGQPLPGVGLAASTGLDPEDGPTAQCSSIIPLSDSEGLISCDLVPGGRIGNAVLTVKIGGYYEAQPIQLTIVPGDPAVMEIVQGNNQSGKPGDRLLTLIASISDAGGNLLPGASATWEVLDEGAVTLSSIKTTADSNGRVSAIATLGNVAGAARVKVTSGDASVTFTLTVNIFASQLVKISGDGQTAIVSDSFSQPLVVEARDAQGNVVSGLPVAFAVTSGTASIGATSVNTGSNGRASTTVTAGATAGPVVVTATAADLSATFNLTVSPPGPVVTSAGIRSAISGDQGVTPGGMVAIYGDALALGIQGSIIANGNLVGPLPTKLADVQVLFGTTPAPIYTVNNYNGQQWIVAQAPFSLGAPGSVSVTIKVGTGETTINDVPVKRYQPGLFETLDAEGKRFAVLLNEDGSYVTRENGAKRGTKVRMFASGLGQTNPALNTNYAGIAGQSVLAKVVIGVNNAGVPVVAAETMPGVVGVYMVTFDLPADTAAGPSRPFAIAIFPEDGGSLIFGNPSEIPVQ